GLRRARRRSVSIAQRVDGGSHVGRPFQGRRGEAESLALHVVPRGTQIIMRFTFACAAAMLIVISVGAHVPHAQAPKRLALVGGMLLTGYEMPPIHHATVLIEGNKIVQAGPASEVKLPSDATVI